MMIGVAQVIGMKPTLRSFFSSGPPCANASVAVFSGKNCDERGDRGRGADRFQEGAPRHVLRKHRAHHGGSDHALVALGPALDRRLDLQLRGGLVLGVADVLAAAAAARVKTAVGIEGIVEGGHDASCLMLGHMEQGACHVSKMAIGQALQAFPNRLTTTKIRDIRKFVAQLRIFGVRRDGVRAAGFAGAVRELDLRTLTFDYLVEPTLLLDPHADQIVDANPAACTLLGYDRALLRETKISALHAGQLPALIVFTQAVLDKGAYWTNALTPRHATGQPLRLEYTGSRLPHDGRALMLLTMSDLDQRRRRYVDATAEDHMRSGLAAWQRVERVFQDIERENQLILRAAGEGIYGVNAEGKTTFVNPAAERMLGWAADELVGKAIHPIVHHSHHDGSHYPDEDCPIYAAFRDGAVHKVDGEVFWRKDGSPVWVEYTSTPIRDRGMVVGAVIVFRDVSQRRDADEKLHAALTEVDRLRERLELENAYLQEEIRIETNPRGIIGQSEAIQKTLRQVKLVAPTTAAVMITGESGTGKELIARAIHEAS